MIFKDKYNISWIRDIAKYGYNYVYNDQYGLGVFDNGKGLTFYQYL